MARFFRPPVFPRQTPGEGSGSCSARLIQIAALLLLVPAGLATARADPPVRIGVEARRDSPLSFVNDKGQPSGFARDLLEEMARVSGIEFKIVPHSWNGLLMEFQAGRLDALANVMITDERRAFMDFSITHASMHGVAYFHSGQPAIRRTTDLAGKKIGMISGTLEYFSAVRHQGWGGTIQPAGTIAALLDSMARGKCEVILLTRRLDPRVVSDNGLQNGYLDDLVFQYHIAVHKGDSATLSRLNEALATVRQNGSFDRIYSRWIGPIEPHPVHLADLRPYFFPAAGILLAVAFVIGWQRRMLAQRADQAAALREAEDRYRGLVESAFDGSAILQDGIIQSVNAALAAMLGYTPDELIGRPAFAVLAPEVREHDGAPGAANQTWAPETVGLRKDGTRITIETAGKACTYQGRPARIAAVRDITGRKRADEKLRESEERFRALFEQAPVGVFYSTVAGKLIRVNSEYARMMGFASPDEVKEVVNRSSIAEAVYVQSDERPGLMQQALANPGSWIRTERQFRKRDGTTITANLVVRALPDHPDQLEGFLEDITERKRAEESLKRLATAVEQVGETIVITDTQGAILYVNPAFEKSSGYTRAEALGQNPRILKSDRHDAEFYRQIWATLARGEVWRGHFTNRRKDGTFNEEEATISPVRNAAGTIVNYVAVKRDVTREAQLQAQFRQAQKMEAVGHLAGGVAHDFNNILAALMMGLELLLMRENLDQETRASLKELQVATQRAAHLTRQLLMFSRRSVLDVRVLDVNELVANLLKMLGRLLGEDIRLVFEPGGALPPVEADAGMLEQVFMNLVVNARDAMPRGGRISLTTEAVAFDPEHIATNPERRAGSFVCLTVADTGCGMDAATLKQIFEPFFTTKEPGKGTGLGLATAYGIVAQHGGWMEVESKVNLGTTFRVYLPKSAKSVAPTEAKKPEPLPTGTETILVVEDDADVRKGLVQNLRKLGYRVFTAAHGPEAMKLWQTYGNQVDLLLTDMMMPEGMTGLELAEKVRMDKPDLKVIISSGYSAEIINRSGKAIAEGIVYLAKPCEMAHLAAVLRHCLNSPQTPR